MLDTSRIDPTLLDQGFLGDCHTTFDALPDRWVVTTGFRSIEESNRLYAIYQAGGPKAAPGGSSPHNYGLAIDFFLWDGSRLPNYDTKDSRWQAMMAAVNASAGLHGGWHFGDGDHVEAVGWKAKAGL